jgi:hypothetical protein
MKRLITQQCGVNEPVMCLTIAICAFLPSETVSRAWLGYYALENIKEIKEQASVLTPVIPATQRGRGQEDRGSKPAQANSL